jgi:RNA polymerase sigma-70 factor (ECF subfamily)
MRGPVRGSGGKEAVNSTSAPALGSEAPGTTDASRARERAVEQLDELGDSQLVILVGRYEERALAEIYRRHGRAAYGLARRILGDAVEAEDVTQDVFLHLWSHPSRFDPARGALRTYLLTRAHGKAVDVVRSRAARARREERDARTTANASYDIDREVSDVTLAQRMTVALEALPADERAAIDLAYFGGHTYREVARLLSAPEGTVKSRIRKGLQRMRSTLVEGGARNDSHG